MENFDNTIRSIIIIAFISGIIYNYIFKEKNIRRNGGDVIISNPKTYNKSKTVEHGDIELNGVYTYELTENIRISYESILKIAAIPNSNKLALLRVNSSYELFIEVIDFEKNTSENVIFKEKFYKTIDNFNKSDKIKYEYPPPPLNGSLVNHVSRFYIFSEKYFYLKIISAQSFDITFDFEGNIINRREIVKQDYKPGSHRPSFVGFTGKYYVTDDFEFLDLESFEKHSLDNFITDFFDDDDFFYIRYMEGYSLFTLSHKNLFGITFFDKDGNNPRGRYSIFKIDDVNHPELLFNHKTDNYLYYSVINSTGTKIVNFIAREFDKGDVIIRELSQDGFENAITFNVTLNERSVPADMVFQGEDTIYLIFYNRIEVFDVMSAKRLYVFNRDYNTPYTMHDNMCFYISENKLILKTIQPCQSS
ncbi:hypothetical protein ACLI1A_05235 [Flavobacterium sp. RHBU_3]|uniref:hypothetical protein n=1 Tax=Flavobacterium sp. RHBU_3 TaxID=3391184 RepID=UPI00398501BA